MVWPIYLFIYPWKFFLKIKSCLFNKPWFKCLVQTPKLHWSSFISLRVRALVSITNIHQLPLSSVKGKGIDFLLSQSKEINPLAQQKPFSMEIHFICEFSQYNCRFTQPLHWITAQEVILTDKLISVFDLLFKIILSMKEVFLLLGWFCPYLNCFLQKRYIKDNLTMIIQIIYVFTAIISPK